MINDLKKSAPDLKVARKGSHCIYCCYIPEV